VITIRFARAYLKAGISAEERVKEYDESQRRLRERAESRKRATKRRIASQRIQEFESRQFEGSRVDGSGVRARQWCNTDGEVGDK
jgi:hypothetical protein